MGYGFGNPNPAPHSTEKGKDCSFDCVHIYYIHLHPPSLLIMKIWNYFSFVFYVIISLNNSSLYSELFSWNRDQMKDEDTQCSCAKHR